MDFYRRIYMLLQIVQDRRINIASLTMFLQVTIIFLLILVCSATTAYAMDGAIAASVATCVILSTRPYHFDVSAFLIYHMQRLGYTTEVWLRSSFIRDDLDGSHSLFKALNVTVVRDVGDGKIGETNPTLKMPAAIKILVVSTADGDSDLPFTCRVGVFEKAYAMAEKVVFVVHNARNAPLMAKYCVRPKCMVLVLAHHVIRATNNFIRASGFENTTSVLGVMARVYNIPAAYLAKQYVSQSSPVVTSESHSIRHIAIQGTLSAERRNYNAFFQCLTEIQRTGRQFKVHMVGWRNSKSPAVTAPPHLASFISMHENLKFDSYFPIIAQSDLLVTFSNSSFSYYSYRGTSSVPTGLNCGVGLVMPASMLQLYPCLRSQLLHWQISRRNDCESLKAAMELNDQQMARLKREASRCRKAMMLDAHELLRSISQAPISAPDSAAVFGKCEDAFLELRTIPVNSTVLHTIP